jgi:hypothetical protein
MRSVRAGLIGAAFLVAAVSAFSNVSNASIVNGSFEAPQVSTYPTSNPPYLVPPNYIYLPNGGSNPVTVDSWTYFGGAGLINGNDPGAYNGESGFDENQYAFIQGSGSYISQVFSATPGIGAIDWIQAGRPNTGCCNGDQTLDIFLNGNLVGAVASASGQVFTAESIAGVSLLSSNTLQFLGIVNADETAFIDNVSVITTSSTPLPSTWTMMLIGLAGLGFVAYRRKQGTALAAV